jgi:hypothetical protein
VEFYNCMMANTATHAFRTLFEHYAESVVFSKDAASREASPDESEAPAPR